MKNLELDPLLGPRPHSWWTGLRPVDQNPVTALPQLNLQTSTRKDVLDYFNNGWLISEVLFSSLQGEAAFMRPPYHSLRHPMIFYYAHPAVLYINKLRLAGFLKEGINTYFEHVFEVGVDEMSWDDMSKNEMKWPSVTEVTEYRRQVYAVIKNLIETHPALDEKNRPFLHESPVWALAMGFEHERIHIETSSVLLREMPLQFLRRPEQWPADFASTSANPLSPNKMIKVREQSIQLGKPLQTASFGWDNEYGERHHKVQAFEASQRLISNGEFLEFVKEGGYRQESLWSKEGWTWRQFRNTKWPVFWIQEGPAGLHQFKLRRIFEEIEFDPSLPAIVNFHEAEAYTRWLSEKEKEKDKDKGKGKGPYRLLTEAEFQSLKREQPQQEWNYNLVSGGESSVDRTLDRNLTDGFGDACGNVWQWCEDDFNPLPGFKVHEFYEDFSTPCFDGKHKMTLGGSFVSTGDESGPWARFHFRPHFHQQAGFRVARSENKDAKSEAVLLSDSVKAKSGYESDELLNQYMLLHFSKNDEVLPYSFAPCEALNFPQRCARVVMDYAQKLKIPTHYALDLGCAVGGATFELTKTFDRTLGVDLSHSFISAANQLKETGSLAFYRKDEGQLGTNLVAQVDPSIDRARAFFRQADATSLPAEFVDFDAVLVANLLCRLPSPRSCLSRMSGPRGIVKRGGLLVLFSPYSWLEEHTPVESWLGGYEKNHQPVRAAETLESFLSPDFELLHQEDVPLMIREHARKFQYIVSHLMVWRRK